MKGKVIQTVFFFFYNYSFPICINSHHVMIKQSTEVGGTDNAVSYFVFRHARITRRVVIVCNLGDEFSLQIKPFLGNPASGKCSSETVLSQTPSIKATFPSQGGNLLRHQHSCAISGDKGEITRVPVLSQ